MHTAGKVLLIIGGIITALGIVMVVVGAANTGLDPESENVWEGTSGDFTIPDDDVYGVYIKGSASDCDQIGSSTSISMKINGEEKFVKSCEHNEDDGYLDDGFQRVGEIGWWTTTGGEEVVIDSSVKIYIVGDIDAFGDAAGGWIAAGLGIVIAVCGGVILLIGIILALTLKSKEPVVVMQQGGQMMGGQMMQQPVQPMQQMQQPVQQMPQQTTQQGYEFEQK